MKIFYIFLLLTILIVSSVNGDVKLEECIEKSGARGCRYIMKPDPICGENRSGQQYEFYGPCEFGKINDCLECKGMLIIGLVFL